jgi:NDP-sugar pyrophosphorylase family protein
MGSKTKGIRLEVTGDKLWQVSCDVSTSFKNDVDFEAPTIVLDFDFVCNSDFLDHYKSESRADSAARAVLLEQADYQIGSFEKQSGKKVSNRRKIARDAVDCVSAHVSNRISDMFDHRTENDED